MGGRAGGLNELVPWALGLDAWVGGWVGGWVETYVAGFFQQVEVLGELGGLPDYGGVGRDFLDVGECLCLLLCFGWVGG